MLVSRNVGITIIVCAISIGITAYVIGDILDYPGSKTTEDPGLLVETKNHKIAKQLVNIVIELYEKSNKDLSLLDNKLDFNVDSQYKRYAFVIDADTKKIIAHPNIDLLGQDSFALMNSTESDESILENLKNNDGYWIHYDFVNPNTGKIEPKTSWFKLHDGLIFGSGFYN